MAELFDSRDVPIHVQVQAAETKLAELRMPEIRLPLRIGQDLIVDAPDLWMFTYFHWSIRKGRHTFYLYRKIKGVALAFHREIIGARPGDPIIDHMNWNGLDNRRHNLRFATHSQNNHNTWHGPRPMTEYVGISIHPASGLWRARTNGAKTSYHKTPLEAALAHDEMAFNLRGEFARLNFPKTSVEQKIQDDINVWTAIVETLKKLQATERT